MCALATGKTNCWLSYVTCPCNQEKAASLRYAHKLCKCDVGPNASAAVVCLLVTDN